MSTASLIALEEVLDRGAGDQRAEATPVHIEAMIVAGQQIYFVRRARPLNCFVQDHSGKSSRIWGNVV